MAAPNAESTNIAATGWPFTPERRTSAALAINMARSRPCSPVIRIGGYVRASKPRRNRITFHAAASRHIKARDQRFVAEHFDLTFAGRLNPGEIDVLQLVGRGRKPEHADAEPVGVFPVVAFPLGDQFLIRELGRARVDAAVVPAA